MTRLFLILMAFISGCGSQVQQEESEEVVLDKDSINTNSISTDSSATQVPLNLIVTNLGSSEAPIIVGLYKSNANFLHDEGRIGEYRFIPTGKTLNVSITDIAYGEYALAIYQDMNDNGKMDKNFFGLPKEGYALSNNFKPSIKAPTFNDCKFSYNASNNTVNSELNKAGSSGSRNSSKNR